MALRSPDLAGTARPGQFCMLRVNRRLDPVLRRPFTFHRILPDRGYIEILYKVVGRGTNLMTGLEPGAFVDVLGPLGNGYAIPEDARTIVTVSRGIGIAGLVALAEEARRRGVNVLALASFSNKDAVTGTELLDYFGCETALHTDDGVHGGTALVTDGLGARLAGRQVDQFYTCGSRRLAMAVYQWSAGHGIPAQVSLEQHMACGMGACMGCVVEAFTSGKRDAKAYRRVCKEGPVFWAWEVCGVA